MLTLFFIQGLLSVFLCAPIKVTDESKSYLDMPGRRSVCFNCKSTYIIKSTPQSTDLPC